MKRELTPSEVLFNVNLNEGQEKIEINDIPQISLGYKKIKRALSIQEEGYNLYLIDTFSKDKLQDLTEFIEGIYEDFEAPRDICYVNMENPKKPEPIFLTNGKGKELKESVDNIKSSYYDVATEFYNSSSESEKDIIIEEIHSKRSRYIGELVELSKAEGFEVKATTGGFAFIPIKEGESMTEKDYEDLPKTVKDSIVEKAGKLKKKAEIVLEKLKNIELKSIKKLKDIYIEYLDIQLEEEKEEILLNFITEDEAYEYLEKLFSNIEKGLVSCYTINIDDDEVIINEFLDKFQITVLVDNSEYEKPRVIYEDDPNTINLIGNVEYENHKGTYTSDISLISPGSLLLANEGCIILRLSQLIMNSSSYYYLKKTLMSGKVSIDSSRNYLDVLSINGLKPKAIPVNVKVIIIGDYESYDILYDSDEDFKKLFPLRSEFSNIVEFNEINLNILKNYIQNRAKKYKVDKVDPGGIKEIIKYLCRIAGSKKKISIDIKEIDKLLVLANSEIEFPGRGTIGATDIIKSAYEEESIEEQIMEMYRDKKILLPLEGKTIGSINGLAVLSSGYYSFGKPLRVTCVVCKGEGKIIDVQKESNLSGNIHEKSINIISGLLSNIVSQYEKLPVDFHLSFEQTYGKIDGDSASVAEILCILSALSKKGINQNIAITGSINQFGEIQPIGGVNEKIEGFHKTCKLLGNSKNKGVLIPSLNKDDIILKSLVEESIDKKEFHIYTMDTLEDAIEIMILDGKTSMEDFYKTINKEILKYTTKTKLG